MIDRGKLSSAMGRVSVDDAKIRAALRDFQKIVDHDRAPEGRPINEAQGREAAHRSSVYGVVKKLFKQYQTELDGAINVLMDITTKQDRALTLAGKMSKGGVKK